MTGVAENEEGNFGLQQWRQQWQGQRIERLSIPAFLSMFNWEHDVESPEEGAGMEAETERVHGYGTDGKEKRGQG